VQDYGALSYRGQPGSQPRDHIVPTAPAALQQMAVEFFS
jgi:hypothetical protein